METATDEGPSRDLLVEIIRRMSALEAFERSALDKRDLASTLAVSRATAHRIITSFESHGFIVRAGDGYELTSLGESVLNAGRRFSDKVRTATKLDVLRSALPAEIEFEYRLFADATVTHATYDDPYRPMNRFVQQFEGATRIKGFNKSFLEPMYIDTAYEQLQDGMVAEIIYDPKVVEHLAAEYPQIAADAFEMSNMASYAHDDLPIALAIFEDEVGIGVHTEDLGTPIAWIETDDPEAIAWATTLFERYREEAQPLS